MDVHRVALDLGRHYIALDLLHHDHKHRHLDGKAQAAGDQGKDALHHAGDQRAEIGDKIQNEGDARKQQGIAQADDRKADIGDDGHSQRDQHLGANIFPGVAVGFLHHPGGPDPRPVRQHGQRAADELRPIQHKIDDEDHHHHDIKDAGGGVYQPVQQRLGHLHQVGVAFAQDARGPVQNGLGQMPGGQQLVGPVQQLVKGAGIGGQIVDHAGDLLRHIGHQQHHAPGDEPHHQKRRHRHGQPPGHLAAEGQQPDDWPQQIGDDGRQKEQHHHIPEPPDHHDQRDQQDHQRQQTGIFHKRVPPLQNRSKDQGHYSINRCVSQ